MEMQRTTTLPRYARAVALRAPSDAGSGLSSDSAVPVRISVSEAEAQATRGAASARLGTRGGGHCAASSQPPVKPALRRARLRYSLLRIVFQMRSVR